MTPMSEQPDRMDLHAFRASRRRKTDNLLKEDHRDLKRFFAGDQVVAQLAQAVTEVEGGPVETDVAPTAVEGLAPSISWECCARPPKICPWRPSARCCTCGSTISMWSPPASSRDSSSIATVPSWTP